MFKSMLILSDSVQFSAAVGVANCGGGPRLQFLAGRSNNTRPAPDLTVPEPSDSADKIFARMSDAGFTPKEVVALLASHSTAVQEHVDPTIPVCPHTSAPCGPVSDLLLALRALLSTRLSAPSTLNSSSRSVYVPCSLF